MEAQGPRGDTLLRAVVVALQRTGYTPVARESSATTSQVVLRRPATQEDSSLAVRLAVTHRPQRRCLQVDLLHSDDPAPARSPGRTVYDYYAALRPEDLPRIVDSLVTTIDAC
jgi:hypothetical protein